MNKEEIEILVVDDDEPIRSLVAMCLGSAYRCSTASTAEEAIEMLQAISFNLVVTDITMPGASGLELCQFVKKIRPTAVVVMMSAMTDIDYAIEAMRQGAFDYITKPFEIDRLEKTVERALDYQARLVAKHRYENILEERIRVGSQDLSSAQMNLDTMIDSMYANYRATLQGLAKTLEARDFETRGHSDRVVAYSLRLGRQIGLEPSEMIGLEQGALLHDIGKIGVRDSVLLKPGSLTGEEWVSMREHVDHGLRIIDGVDFLSGARFVIGQHHEKYDGSGYPSKLRGQSIHLHARIFAVADAFDAMTSDRPYRAGRSYARASEEIISKAGSHFDPSVVKAFLQVPEAEWAQIRSSPQIGNYGEKVIDKEHLRSFIASLRCSKELVAPLKALSA